MRKKSKAQFLRRPIRYTIRFNSTELRQFKSLARKARLSAVEFGRRRILGLPIEDVSHPIEAQPAAIGSAI